MALATQTTPLPIRIAQLAFELLLSATLSFLLTSALLPFFGLHATTLTVMRVTGVCTLIVFAALEGFCGEVHRSPVVANENPEFKLHPRALRDSEAGWPPREGGNTCDVALRIASDSGASYHRQPIFWLCRSFFGSSHEISTIAHDNR
ncbi:hypothetical protein MVEN_00290700 [Mycena venus]|uniref:Uncharacterized protein n=1 Tax=Mycena venus TaxID=2733690 RepID=A0A8H6YYX0_9AGAR|nr:hypothetical protein MVEN_00290700 [Mycena venus]